MYQISDSVCGYYCCVTECAAQCSFNSHSPMFPQDPGQCCAQQPRPTVRRYCWGKKNKYIAQSEDSVYCRVIYRTQAKAYLMGNRMTQISSSGS